MLGKLIARLKHPKPRSAQTIMISTLEAGLFCAAYGDERDRRLVRNVYEGLARETINGRLPQQEGLLLALRRAIQSRMTPGATPAGREGAAPAD